MVAIRGRWAPQKPVQEPQVSVWSHHGPVWGPDDKYLGVKPLDVGVGPGGEAGKGLRRRFSCVGLAGPCTGADTRGAMGAMAPPLADFFQK